MRRKDPFAAIEDVGKSVSIGRFWSLAQIGRTPRENKDKNQSAESVKHLHDGAER